MNRDELRSRAPELGPQDHGTWLGPRDGERGGTWFGLNRRGAVACLLNDYPETDDPEPALPPPRDGPSRGELIPRLLQAGGPMRQQLETLDLTPFPPFMLLLLEEEPWFVRWGTRLQWEPVKPGWSLWSSSGWRNQTVQRSREERFAAWTGEDVLAFHTLPDTLVDRTLSATRSITQVLLRKAQEKAVLRYWPAPNWPPHPPATELTLPREGG